MHSHRLQILLDDKDRRQAAARDLLEARDMDVPDVADLRDELDALRDRRG